MSPQPLSSALEPLRAAVGASCFGLCPFEGGTQGSKLCACPSKCGAPHLVGRDSHGERRCDGRRRQCRPQRARIPSTTGLPGRAMTRRMPPAGRKKGCGGGWPGALRVPRSAVVRWCARSALRSTDWPQLFERSGHGPRSEFCGPTSPRASQGSPAAGGTTRMKPGQPPPHPALPRKSAPTVAGLSSKKAESRRWTT